MFPEKKLENKQFRDPHESMVLNPLTLGFTGEQAHFERMYWNFSAQQVLKANRAALVASIAAYSLFGILDAFLVPRLKCFSGFSALLYMIHLLSFYWLYLLLHGIERYNRFFSWSWRFWPVP